MNKRNAGFTLIEMLVVIAIFGFVLAGVSQMFVSILQTHRQQSRITETSIEGIIGLELLRQDLGKAGYGLPWNGLTAYTEATGNPYNLNDASNPPRGIVSANNVTAGPSLLGTDYLAIKATNIAINDACGKWAFLLSTGVTTTWTPSTENLSPNDRVIVLSSGALSLPATARTLITAGGFFSQFSTVAAFRDTSTNNPETRIVYGVDSTTNLSRPFNRADYYVRTPSTGMPQRCAAGTGNLYKEVVNQSDGNMTAMPLLDCVADMQVIFRWDQLSNGVLQPINDISGLSVQAIRDQVKEVRVYILAHEGQRDANFSYPANPPTCVGCDSTVGVTGSLGTPSFNFSGITNWQNYRWKIYTLVVKLDNLQ